MMNKRDKADWDFWKRVAALLDTNMHGWSYRDHASFVFPNLEVDGKVAAKLIEQDNEIKRLRALARHAINIAADNADGRLEEWAEATYLEVSNV